MTSFIVAGQADIRQRLNADGLATPLLSPVWTQAVPPAANVNLGTLRSTVGAMWYAPLAGMLVPASNGRQLGLSGLDGTPAEPACAVLKVHPQVRLRLERQFVASLQAAGSLPVDRSLRPVPATILIRNLVAPFTLAQQLAAAELAMPAGDVSMYDEHGLIIDPFAFAPAVTAVLIATPALSAPMPAGPPLGTPPAIAGLAPPAPSSTWSTCTAGRGSTSSAPAALLPRPAAPPCGGHSTWWWPTRPVITASPRWRPNSRSARAI